MGFYFRDLDSRSFVDFKELIQYAEEERDVLGRQSIADMITRGAKFYDDHSFGLPSEGLQLNEEGLRDFCHLFHLPLAIVQGAEKDGLATDLLNDLLLRASILDELEKHDVVVNKREHSIVGVVSRSYVTYSNLDLLRDLVELVKDSGLDPNKGLQFEAGHVVNTKMRVRFLSKMEAGIARGKAGTVPDKSIIGFQFTNSMTGDCAVRIEFYLKRLICTNGMVAPVSHTENVVFHSGKEENFLRRLEDRYHAILRGVERIQELWQMLADIEFDPYRLAKCGFTPEILDIYPDHRDALKAVGSELEFEDDVPKEERRVQRDAAALAAIPKLIGTGDSAKVFRAYWRDNKTMFDFVNLFTEKAKECENVRQRIQVEEKTGLLADRLFKNRKKLTARE